MNNFLNKKYDEKHTTISCLVLSAICIIKFSKAFKILNYDFKIVWVKTSLKYKKLTKKTKKYN